MSPCEIVSRDPAPAPPLPGAGSEITYQPARLLWSNVYSSVSLKDTEEDTEEVAVEVEADGYRGGA